MTLKRHTLISAALSAALALACAPLAAHAVNNDEYGITKGHSSLSVDNTQAIFKRIDDDDDDRWDRDDDRDDRWDRDDDDDDRWDRDDDRWDRDDDRYDRDDDDRYDRDDDDDDDYRRSRPF